MRGLERFEEVLIDFADVEEVGQGLVDEVLRVWPNQYPRQWSSLMPGRP
jgi:hypothetical protein